MHHYKNHNHARRRASVLIVTVGIALLAAGCGGGSPGGSSSQAATSTNYQKLVAYAQCMRTHGVPNFPDPNGQGAFNGNGLNFKSAQFQAAQTACRHLAPNGGNPPSAAQRAQAVSQMLKFSQCMRSHGVPKYPDPGSNGSIRISISSGINPQSPQYQSAQRACQSLAPGQANGSAPGGSGSGVAP